MDLAGVGPVVAARILADVGDVARFADRNRFASWTGTAPLDASSGEQIRHRLSRAGNRRANHMIHIAAASQLRHDTPGRAYYRRKLAAGKTPLHLLDDLNREGLAIVLTTHDLNGMAAHLPDLLALRQRVVASGPPGEVIVPGVVEEVFGARMEILEHLGMPVVVDSAADGPERRASA